MPTLSDNVTMLAITVVIGLCVWAIAWTLAKPLHRIADELRDKNKTRAADLKLVRGEISDEIKQYARTASNEVYDQLDGQVAQTNTTVDELGTSVTRLEGNVANLTQDVTTVAEHVGIAGNELWSHLGGADGRVERDGLEVQIATDQPAAGHYPTDGETVVQPAVGPYTPGEHTGAIMVGAAASAASIVFPEGFDPNNRRSVWDFMYQRNRERGSNVWPWDVDPTMPQGDRIYCYYDTDRAAILQAYGVSIPSNMHKLWPSLYEHDSWQQYGPQRPEETPAAARLPQP